MPETLRISDDEIKRLTTGRTVDRPKYTFFALNKAVEYSGANAKSTLGDIGEIYDKFEDEHPNGDFEDWQQYYKEEYGGEHRLEEATEEAFDKLLVIREAIKQIDKDDVRNFIEGFAIYGTYESGNVSTAIAEKMTQELADCEEIDQSHNTPDKADLRYGEYYLTILPEDMKENTDHREAIRPIYYTHIDDGISVDLSRLNTSLGDY